tara:strand:- start:66 stop:311 length:246 start_codon:yes stop_codon:yes gene_type:complete
MARIEVEVDIDIEEYLDEVDTDDLIDELASRDLDSNEISRISTSFSNSIDFKSTLLDELKTEVVLNGFKNKSLEELEKFFK